MMLGKNASLQKAEDFHEVQVAYNLVDFC